jgi:hypothetical protein
MSKGSDLLKFLVEHKMSIQEAIDLLKTFEPVIRRKIKETAVIKDYEKR